MIMKSKKLNFVNTALNTFPLEDVKGVHQVKGFIYSKVTPTPIINPKIIGLSKSCFAQMGLSDFYEEITTASEEQQNKYAELFSGNSLFDGSVPISHNYCGH